ncbi:hypothetical protein CPB86DRAFT_874109 [Serendipita vermifera]|nr:hypothetical protein CPB86DRAFT_874109 [Serendipita vermifera]
MDDTGLNETRLEEERRQILAKVTELGHNKGKHKKEILFQKQKYNAIMDRLYALAEPRRIDPMDRLPIELWHGIIYAVILPFFRPNVRNFYGRLPDDIFVFMLVSNRWRQCILEMRFLWTTVTLGDHVEDHLHKAVMSLHLSQNMPIYLQVALPIVGWDTVKEALIRNRRRISILHIYPRNLPSSESDSAHDLLENCMKELFPLPLNQLIVETSSPKWPSLIQLFLEQCRSLREILRINLTEETLNLDISRRLKRFQTTENLMGLVKQKFPTLYDIKFTYSRAKPEEKLDTGEHPLSWKKINIYSAQDISLLPRLKNVVTLELVANGASLRELLCRLHFLVQLKYLDCSTTFAPEHKDTLPVLTEVSTNHSVENLRLTFVTRAFPPIPPQDSISYFEQVQELYLKALSSIQELTVGSFTITPAQFFDSRSFPRLSNLYIQSVPSQTDTIVFSKSIENIYLETGLHTNYFAKLSSSTAQRLTISSQIYLPRTPSDGLPYHIEPDKWPALMSLTIPVSNLTGRIGAFPSLRNLSLRVSFSNMEGTEGIITRFCRNFAMNPTWFPALEHLRLFQLPEWDIFFIMLERRNITVRSEVTPLKIVTLPDFYPKELFEPIQSLIQGKFPTRPSNYNLSLSGNIEIICNSEVPGCFMCLRSLLVCSTALKEKASQPAGKTEFPDLTSPSLYPEMDADILSTWEERSKTLKTTYLDHSLRLNACHRHTHFNPPKANTMADSCRDPLESCHILDLPGYFD